MFYTIVGAGAASRYGSGSDQKVRLLAAPAPQHCDKVRKFKVIRGCIRHELKTAKLL
jgi:hypothetical protein